MNLASQPHKRFNPLTREWVLVSPHRTQRPWQGQVEKPTKVEQPSYDPHCYLCPGNPRAGGVQNPQYTSTFVFDNDFAALKPDVEAGHLSTEDLLVAESERGICRVVCFDPNHSLTVARMSQDALRKVVDTWVEQYRELGQRESIRYVQIFENRGEMMGASNPHPHCQIWSTETLPNEVAKESAAQAAWLQTKGHCLLCDYVRVEESAKERIVCENDSFLALVPFWAVWPFEAMLIAREHAGSMAELSDKQKTDLAAVMKALTTRYDNLFQISFPYTMGFHQSPTDGHMHPEWHFHAHYYPPLLRSATVRKFMVGFEMLGMPQRDITPESAAARLRELPAEHYAD